MTAYSAYSSTGVPFASIGESDRRLFVFPGIDLAGRVPEGLHLQGIVQAFRAFADDYRVIFVGRPTAPEGLDEEGDGPGVAADSEDATQRVLSFVQDELRTGGEPPVVMGLSSGGGTAVRMAAALDRDLAALALVSFGARVSEEGRRALAETAGLIREGAYRRLSRVLVERLYPGAVGRLVYGPVAWLFPELAGRPPDPSEVARAFEHWAAGDLTDALGLISVPTLLVAGSRDIYYPRSTLEETCSLIPDCAFKLVEGYGHGVFKARRREVHDEVRKFLQDPAGYGTTGKE